MIDWLISCFTSHSTAKVIFWKTKAYRDLKFCIEEEEGLYYLCSENKCADQLCGHREAGLRLFFFAYANCWFFSCEGSGVAIGSSVWRDLYSKKHQSFMFSFNCCCVTSHN